MAFNDRFHVGGLLVEDEIDLGVEGFLGLVMIPEIDEGDAAVRLEQNPDTCVAKFSKLLARNEKNLATMKNSVYYMISGQPVDNFS